MYRGSKLFSAGSHRKVAAFVRASAMRAEFGSMSGCAAIRLPGTRFSKTFWLATKLGRQLSYRAGFEGIWVFGPAFGGVNRGVAPRRNVQ